MVALANSTESSTRVTAETHTPVIWVYVSGLRYYSPEIGRWVNRDPIEERGSAQILEHHLSAILVAIQEPIGRDTGEAQPSYCFVGNDPHNRFDLHGLQDSAADPCSRCGPDISQPLRSVIWKVRGDFYGWGRIRRWRACRSLDQLPWALGAWDIRELSPSRRQRLNTYCEGCPTRDCWNTAEVDEGCYLPAAVNYVLFGTMGDLCGWSLTRTLWLVEMYKRSLGHPHGASWATTAWAVAGYNGWPRYPTPESDDRYSHCTTDCDPYTEGFSYIWSGSAR